MQKPLEKLQEALSKEFESERAFIAADRKKLSKERIEVNREVSLKKSKLEALKKKETTLKESVGKLEQKKTDLSSETQNLTDDLRTSRLKLKALDRKKYSTLKKTELLEATLEERKRDLNSETEDHRIQLEQDLSEIKSDVDLATVELVSVKDEVKYQQDELNKIKNAQAEAKESDIAEIQKLEGKKKVLSKENQNLTDERDKLKEEVYLEAQKLTMVREEIHQLNKKHEDLVRYERQSQAKLKAKDEELQKREANLKNEEIMLSNRRSILPPM